ncbi:type II toxin-antitoxin system VapC family toxin [Candidatus Bathyarchaeota archaeon]|nr:type II toxin-antitoxin system VapC family toxin [Candidatus Bathyarchaeota archaeon]
MLRLYLDSSAIVKRYVTEPGSATADLVFEQAESGELIITFSLWNIGEVLGVLDERRSRGWLSEAEFSEAAKIFSNELSKLMRLRALEIVPVYTSILVETWSFILGHHIYEADALQITTCTHAESQAMLSGDEKLIKASRRLGLRAFDVVREEHELADFIRTA